jgi:hypothetical protein
MTIDSEFLKSIGLSDEAVTTKLMEKIHESEKGLLSKRDELLELTTSQKRELEKYQSLGAEHEQMKKRIQEQEREKLTEEERIQLAREEAAKEWESKLSEVNQKLEELSGKERERIRNEAVFRSVGDKGDADLILDVVSSRGLVKVGVDKDGKNVLKIISLDGKELDSIDKLMDQMKASEKYQRLWNSSGLSGGGSMNSSSKGSKDLPGLFGAAKMRAARQSK